MSVILFKDGSKAVVDPYVVDSHLKNGWSTSNNPADTEEKQVREMAKKAGIQTHATANIDDIKFMLGEKYEKKNRLEQADLDQDPVLLSEDDLRKAAKEAGIKNWHNKKLENIKAELDVR